MKKQSNIQAGVAKRPQDIEEVGLHSAEEGHRYRKTDQHILRDCQEQIMEGDRFNTDNVRFEVNEGIVKLYGTVDSQYTLNEIDQIVQDTVGVQGVENHLKVLRISDADLEDASPQKTRSTGIAGQESVKHEQYNRQGGFAIRYLPEIGLHILAGFIAGSAGLQTGIRYDNCRK